MVQDLRRVAIEELKKVETSLDKESSEDAELRDKYGSRWNRPASAALNSSMREKIAGYNANLTAAGDSDARLEQRLMQNNAAFSALSIDAAVAQMPRLQVSMGLLGLGLGLGSGWGRLGSRLWALDIDAAVAQMPRLQVRTGFFGLDLGGNGLGLDFWARPV